MKALPPPPIQLELLPTRPLAVAQTKVDPSARREVLRALAEILLDAADVEGTDETR